MDTTLIILVLILALTNGALLWMLLKRRTSGSHGDNKAFLMLQNQLENLTQTVDSKIEKGSEAMNKAVQEQFSHSQKLIREITKEITEVKETNKQVFTITDSLKNLEKVLKNQKQRGNLGEAGLELILQNILPPSAYEMQYQFSDGSTVDAVIKAKEGLIPIDAKFSLDNYNRIVEEEDEERRKILEKEFSNDLKKRIDETSKYIKPSEGTLPFALMYIPAEGIYYDLLVNEVGAIKVNTRSLIEYAYKDKKVIIVSPTTFVAYLQTILQGFRAFQIEERAKEIEKNVEKLGRHIKAYDDYHARLGSSLSTTVNHYNRSRKELGKIDKDVYRITGESGEIDVELLERPSQE